MNKVYVIQHEFCNEDGEVTSEVLKTCYADKQTATDAMMKAANAEKGEFAENHPDWDMTAGTDHCIIDDKMGNEYHEWDVVEVVPNTSKVDVPYLKQMIRQDAEALYKATSNDYEDDVIRSIKRRLDEEFEQLYGKGA